MNLNEVTAAPSPIKVVCGKLTPRNAEAAKDRWTRISLTNAFKENGLRHLVNDSTWDETGITFSSAQSILSPEDTATELVDALIHVMHTEAAKELELSGVLNLTFGVGVASPTVIRVIVENGAVGYQKAEYLWPNAVTV